MAWRSSVMLVHFALVFGLLLTAAKCGDDIRQVKVYSFDKEQAMFWYKKPTPENPKGEGLDFEQATQAKITSVTRTDFLKITDKLQWCESNCVKPE